MSNSDSPQSRSGWSGPRRGGFGLRPWRGRPRNKFRDSRPTNQVEELPTVDPETIAASGFAKLGLPDRLVGALIASGITEPFEIQSATIPDALAGKDILGRGRTGSGKTLAFGLAVLAKVSASGKPKPHHPQALVLVPTRELAMQVADVLMPLGKSLGVFVRTALGGVPYDRQIDALRRGVDVLVATPGRLGDLIKRGSCSLDDIEITVIDEADQLADMGFLPDITELIEQTPQDGQRLLFSATLDRDVDVLVRRFMKDPVTHSIEPSTDDQAVMEHHILVMQPRDKAAVTASIAARKGRTIMFVRTQVGVDQLVDQLATAGVRAGALHGGKTQRVRTRTLAEFREGRTNVLVATDVAARGIHVDGISLVVHVDPPKDPKDYLHRAGRTARAGESGRVVTLLVPRQRKSTLAMLDRAGVEPAELRVRTGDPALADLIGASVPGAADGSAERHDNAGQASSDEQRLSGDTDGYPAQPATAPEAAANRASDTREARDGRPWRDRREGPARSDDGQRRGWFSRRESSDRSERSDRSGHDRRGSFGDDRRGGYQRREGGGHQGGYQRREGGSYQGGGHQGGYQRRDGGQSQDGDRGGRDWYPRSAPRRGEFGGPRRDFGGPTRGDHAGHRHDGGQWRDGGRDSAAGRDRGANRDGAGRDRGFSRDRAGHSRGFSRDGGRDRGFSRDHGFGRDHGQGGQRPSRRYSS